MIVAGPSGVSELQVFSANETQDDKLYLLGGAFLCLFISSFKFAPPLYGFEGFSLTMKQTLKDGGSILQLLHKRIEARVL